MQRLKIGDAQWTLQVLPDAISQIRTIVASPKNGPGGDRRISIADDEAAAVAAALLAPMPGEDPLLKDMAEAALAICAAIAAGRAGDYRAATKAALKAIRELAAVRRQLRFKLNAAQAAGGKAAP